MKRSQVNAILEEGDAFLRSFSYTLPPFAYWSPDELVANCTGEDRSLVAERRMGWDVTDYAAGKFAETGLFLFTVRNGLLRDLQAGGGMVYAEKIMITRKDQLAPMHRHNVKAEDIINRGGGTLVLELFNSDPEGWLDGETKVTVPVDGQLRTVDAGGLLKLEPGESVTLMPGVWHAFWAEKADVLIGEVSTVNDDETDNVFREDIPRFTAIEEDEAPKHLLVSDYDAWLPGGLDAAG
ncbi:MAG: D-lyxose/D-mannose family sugar isomerase [Devosiaceae bacterium]|nr:D-lyxose/D-mannose family sugar isomerase [Devosiaceae bacterium MH13]